MKVKTSELIDAALDWAVAQAIGTKPVYNWRAFGAKHYGAWETAPAFGSAVMLRPYSSDWAQGGPIKTRERISTQIKHDGWWVACIYNMNDDPTYIKLAHSELVAAMRCYVASKLGDEVDIPKELT